MNPFFSKARKLHGFLTENLFYPLVLSTALAMAFFAGRVALSDEWTFRAMVWNLFLAWIPYLISLAAQVIHRWRPKGWWAVLPPGLLWLLFFPNAPYILTDLIHLRPRSIPLWYDNGLLLTFALSGCFLAIVSLRSMQKIVNTFIGQVLSWVFVIGTIGLTSFGIYLGRQLRWNSWDILTHPVDILRDMYAPLRYPHWYKETIAFSLMFAAIIFVFYLTFNWLRPLKENGNPT